jgi:hypothetical protein
MSKSRVLVTVCLLLAACGGNHLPEEQAPESGEGPVAPEAHEAGITEDFDVIVVGAGPGGIGAALQASRQGRTVALLEETAHVGGQFLTVTSMDEGGTGLSTREDGLYKEFVDRLKAFYGSRPLGTCYLTAGSVCYEPAVGEQVLRAMLATRQGTGLPRFLLSTGTRVVSVQKDAANKVTGLTTADGTVWTSRIVIDATEYGDLMRLAGVAYRVGNSKWEPGSGVEPTPTACVQDETYTLTMRKYDSFASMPLGLDVRSLGAPGSDYASVRTNRFATKVQNTGTNCTFGGYPWSFATHNGYRGVPDRNNATFYNGTQCPSITKTMVNLANDYPGTGDSTGFPVAAIENPTERVRHECLARLRTLQFMYYVQSSTTGTPAGLGQPWTVVDEGYGAPAACDTAIIPAAYRPMDQLFPQLPYVREARRMIGVTTLTGKQIARTGPSKDSRYQYSAAQEFPTSLAVGHYAVDLHGCTTTATLEADLNEVETDVPPGFRNGPFQIPFGAFIPRNVDGFLVAEKNLSVSRLGNGAIRLQPISLLTGQAAGTLAALAIERGVQPRAVPPVLVQRRLLNSGLKLALHVYSDVPRTHLYWKDTNLIATHGIMIGTGSFLFGVGDALTREVTAVILQKTFRYHVSNPPDWSPLRNFADVPSTRWTYPYVEAMVREGMTSGCGTNSSGQPLFCPESPANRGQLATFIIKALKRDTFNTACATAPYPDVPTTHPFCPAIQQLKSLGIAVPCSTGGFCPDQTITRGETSAFLANSMEYMAKSTSPVGACYRTPPNYCQ